MFLSRVHRVVLPTEADRMRRFKNMVLQKLPVASEQLLEWIRQGKARGESREQLEKGLRKAGYSEKSIQEAFSTQDGARKRAPGQGILLALVLVVLVGAAYMLLQPTHNPWTSTESLRQKGDDAWTAGDYATAEKYFLAVLEQQPDDSKANSDLGWIFFNEKGNSEAERLFIRALELDRQNSEALYGLGRVAFRRGNYSAAAEHIEKSYQLSPDRVNRLAALIKSLVFLGKRDEALSYLLEGLGKEPGNEELLELRVTLEASGLMS